MSGVGASHQDTEHTSADGVGVGEQRYPSIFYIGIGNKIVHLHL